MTTLATFATALVALSLATGAAAQQNYPSKPIRWIVPSSAGGGN
ncbi:MAG: tripartite tricarboxylate transporter substrate binding protein, partial [Burkholderiales bacterium]